MADRRTFNVVILGVGFLFIFTAFTTCGNVEVSHQTFIYTELMETYFDACKPARLTHVLLLSPLKVYFPTALQKTHDPSWDLSFVNGWNRFYDSQLWKINSKHLLRTCVCHVPLEISLQHTNLYAFLSFITFIFVCICVIYPEELLTSNVQEANRPIRAACQAHLVFLIFFIGWN